WQATSRGVATEFGVHNVGPMSVHSLQGLQARGIAMAGELRMPARLAERDLASADRIIALNEIEHRPLIEARFVRWAGRVEYWDVPDLDVVPADVALPSIERAVRALILELV
ncbi:MAG: low molecular weight phosphatase family protein, partial [Anaerolineae bacterium]